MVITRVPNRKVQGDLLAWLERDNLVCCPDPEERVVMRIERIGERELRTEDLT